MKLFLISILIFGLYFSNDLAAQQPGTVGYKQIFKKESTYYGIDKEKDLIKNIDSLNKSKKTKEVILLKIKKQLDLSVLKLNNQKFAEAFELAHQSLKESQEYKLKDFEFLSILTISLIHEINKNLVLARQYLDEAYNLFEKNNLNHLVSTYHIRSSSVYRINKQYDLAYEEALKAKNYAEVFNNDQDITDANLLLGILSKNRLESIQYFKVAKNMFLRKGDVSGGTVMLLNIAKRYIEDNLLDSALAYADTASLYLNLLDCNDSSLIFKIKRDIYELMNVYDSAFYYQKNYYSILLSELEKSDAIEVIKLSEKYNHEKAVQTIKNKNQLLFLLIIIVSLIFITSFILWIKNRKIKSQHLIIQEQVNQLTNSLNQKKVLFSELQHRVKNNLQHVISILELQKESIDFNNIEELIRENQNRIHSIALLHKKLNTEEAFNLVHVGRYFDELSDLVKMSYENYNINVSINVRCDVDYLEIDKTLPIGLILVELISNSIKHAFKDKKQGKIEITLRHYPNNTNHQYTLHYKDDGDGFDFNNIKVKGLGNEIIKGLIKQLYGIYHTNNENGFNINIKFN